MRAACARALDIPETRIFLKERARMRLRQESGAQYHRMATTAFYRDVHEGDMRFRVNLSDYLDTGLFLDARKKRALVRTQAAGKRVLNLFAYTCSLSVCAALGGAVEVTSVDLSNTYLEWGKVNCALNKIDTEARAEAVTFIRADVLQFIQEAQYRAAQKRRWDYIILDPPSFSNSKKMRGSLDIRRDHGRLIQQCLALLAPGGTLLFSSGAKSFRLDERILSGGNSPHSLFYGVTVQDMQATLADEDFRGKRTPACYCMRRV
jgi:23S rRNA G2069 N7-methylase RlmK/C1962 C5-methylase RlmI